MRARFFKSCAFLLPILAAVLAGWSGLHGDLVHDDRIIFREHPSVVAGRPLDAFTRPYWGGEIQGPGEELQRNSGLYRPIAVAGYALQRKWFGRRPDELRGSESVEYDTTGLHAISLLLHCLAVGLLVWVVLIATRRWVVAGITGALFAVHPVHVEVVAGIVGQAELLATVGGLAALVLFSPWFRREGRRGALAAGSGCIALLIALLSKESALAFLGLIPVFHFLLLGRGAERTSAEAIARGARRAWPVYGGIVAALAVVAFARWQVLGGVFRVTEIRFLNNPFANLGFFERMANAFVVLGEWMRVLFLPIRLSGDYSYQQLRPIDVDWIWPAALLYVALWCCVLYLVHLTLRRRSSWLLVIALFVFPYLLVSNVIVPIGTAFNERLVYLPSAALCLGFALLLARGAVSSDRRIAFGAIGLVALMVVLLGLRSDRRNLDWQTQGSFIVSSHESSPLSAKMWYDLGVLELRKDAGSEVALACFERATELYPAYALAWYNRGVVLERTCSADLALASYEEAAASDSSHAQSRERAALFHYVEKRYGRAETLLVEALRIQRDLPVALATLAAVRRAQGHGGEAENARFESQLSAVWWDMAARYDSRGNRKRALACAQLVLKLKPDHGEAQNLLKGSSQ